LPEEPQPQVQPAWAQLLAQAVSAQQDLPYPWQVPQREPEVSVVLLRVPQAQEPLPLAPDASAPLSPPHPSRLYRPWLWLLPPLPRPLLPEYVSAPSPQHLREWSSSAFSFL
jgi:hypothetical protein